MSFGHAEGASNPAAARGRIEEGFTTVGAGIFRINTAVSSFRWLVDVIGSPKDSPEHRHKLQEARRTIVQLVKATSVKLNSFSDFKRNTQPIKKMEEMKLVRDFHLVLLDFKNSQKLASELEAVFPLTSGSIGVDRSRSETDEENQTLLWEEKRQEILSLENDIMFNEAIIEEREQGIEEMHSDIEQVHEIFKGLAALLHDQGSLVALNPQSSDPSPTGYLIFLQTSKLYSLLFSHHQHLSTLWLHSERNGY